MIVSMWLNKFWDTVRNGACVACLSAVSKSRQPLTALDNFCGLLYSNTFLISFLLFVVYAFLVFIYFYSFPWSSCLPFLVYS